jgi:hypothetical protein
MLDVKPMQFSHSLRSLQLGMKQSMLKSYEMTVKVMLHGDEGA